MKRTYKGWEIKYQGRDKNGGYWMVISPSFFIPKGETTHPEGKYTEVLNSFSEAKKHIDEMIKNKA